jgi:hypothetical protein
MSAQGRLLGSIAISVAAFAAAAAAPPAVGAAVKGFVIGVDAAPVSAPGGDVAYVTRRIGRDTKLIETASGGLGAVRSVRLAGRFSVPVVAYDGSPSGLSADGRTLVLINPRTSLRRRTTTLAIVDASSLRLRRVLKLHGNLSFDAISPDGRTLFFIRYTNPRDTTQYSVRAYDMRTQRMLPGRIVDPSEPDEDMSGLPMTRATGPDGRWAYTLYDGNEHPFIHALDTVRRSAVCIDMDMLAGRPNGIGDLKLRPSGDRLDVLAGTQVLASVDTSTHELIRRVARRQHPRPEEEASFPWLLIAGPTAALMLLAAVGRRRSATRTAAP